VEVEHSGDDIARKDFDPVLVTHRRVIVILPRKADLVFRVRQLLLESDEVLIGLEIGICLGEGEKGTQGLGEDIPTLARSSIFPEANRLLARLDNRLQVCRS
jgi:hypothetical protein